MAINFNPSSIKSRLFLWATYNLIYQLQTSIILQLPAIFTCSSVQFSSSIFYFFYLSILYLGSLYHPFSRDNLKQLYIGMFPLIIATSSSSIVITRFVHNLHAQDICTSVDFLEFKRVFFSWFFFLRNFHESWLF